MKFSFLKCAAKIFGWNSKNDAFYFNIGILHYSPVCSCVWVSPLWMLWPQETNFTLILLCGKITNYQACSFSNLFKCFWTPWSSKHESDNELIHLQMLVPGAFGAHTDTHRKPGASAGWWSQRAPPCTRSTEEDTPCAIHTAGWRRAPGLLREMTRMFPDRAEPNSVRSLLLTEPPLWHQRDASPQSRAGFLPPPQSLYSSRSVRLWMRKIIK